MSGTLKGVLFHGGEWALLTMHRTMYLNERPTYPSL